jgi:hypothetical protein
MFTVDIVIHARAVTDDAQASAPRDALHILSLLSSDPALCQELARKEEPTAKLEAPKVPQPFVEAPFVATPSTISRSTTATMSTTGIQSPDSGIAGGLSTEVVGQPWPRWCTYNNNCSKGPFLTQFDYKLV